VDERLRRPGIRRPPAVSAEQVRDLYDAGQSVRRVAGRLGIRAVAAQLAVT
jgi:hypothetical protein